MGIFLLVFLCDCQADSGQSNTGNYAANKQLPNIVFILADDLGYGDVSYNAGKICTPAIDRIANEGMIFSDAHTASAVCTPTRYGLLTGRYPWRSRLQSGVIATTKITQPDGSVKTGDEPLIKTGQLTVGDLLKSKGYKTAIVGKWHLGFWYDMPSGIDIEINNRLTNAAPIGTKIIGGPLERGFDQFWGFHYAREMRTWIEKDTVTNVLSHPREMLPLLAKTAANYLSEQTVNQPFFLYVPLSSPHTPIVPNREWQGKSKINRYADFIMETDDAVNQILLALDKNPAIRDNTIVVFSADNGASHKANFKELLQYNHDSSGGLRGAKSDLYEGGHRVPFAVRWPGVIKPGSHSDEVISLNCLIATTAELLNIDIPDNQAPDSFSILKILKGEKLTQPTHPIIIMHSVNGYLAVRQGDWKFIAHRKSGGWNKGEDEVRGWVIDYIQPVQLFNLANDLREQYNLAASKSEKTKQMIFLLEKAITDGRTTEGKILGNDSNMDAWRTGLELPK